MHAERPARVRADLDEVGVLRVMDGDLAVEAQRKPRCDQVFHGAAARTAAQPGGDEDRLLLGRNPQPLELLGGGDDGDLPRVLRGRRDRERRRLDEERDPRPAPDE